MEINKIRLHFSSYRRHSHFFPPNSHILVTTSSRAAMLSTDYSDFVASLPPTHSNRSIVSSTIYIQKRPRAALNALRMQRIVSAAEIFLCKTAIGMQMVCRDPFTDVWKQKAYRKKLWNNPSKKHAINRACNKRYFCVLERTEFRGTTTDFDHSNLITKKLEIVLRKIFNHCPSFHGVKRGMPPSALFQFVDLSVKMRMYLLLKTAAFEWYYMSHVNFWSVIKRCLSVSNNNISSPAARVCRTANWRYKNMWAHFS